MSLTYYDFAKLMSFNAVLNFLVGGRGLGKTYGWKKMVIKDAITKGWEFMYVRRYKEELKAAKASFFADVGAEFPEYDFRINGETAEFSPITLRAEKKREWFRAGYFVALSQGQSRKSTAYPKVRKIGFDEFIIEKGMVHYLPDEARVLQNLLNTVDRYQDKTRVFFMANSVSIDNPYFLHYEIEPVEGEEFIRKFDNFILCHFPKGEEFQAGVAKTRLGKFLIDSDPEYAEYAVGNEFKDNHQHLLDSKPPAANYVYTLETSKGIFSVWMDWGDKKYYIQAKRPKQEIIFTLEAGKMADGKKLLFKNDHQIQVLRAAFKANRVNFDKAPTRVAMLDVFKR